VKLTKFRATFYGLVFLKIQLLIVMPCRFGALESTTIVVELAADNAVVPEVGIFEYLFSLKRQGSV